MNGVKQILSSCFCGKPTFSLLTLTNWEKNNFLPKKIPSNLRGIVLLESYRLKRIFQVIVNSRILNVIVKNSSNWKKICIDLLHIRECKHTFTGFFASLKKFVMLNVIFSRISFCYLYRMLAKTSSNWMEIRIAKPYFDFFVGTYFYTFWRFFSSLKISQKWSEMYTNVIRLSLLGFLVLNFLISQKWIQMKMLQVSEKLKNIVTMNQLLKWLQTKVVLNINFKLINLYFMIIDWQFFLRICLLCFEGMPQFI